MHLLTGVQTEWNLSDVSQDPSQMTLVIPEGSYLEHAIGPSQPCCPDQSGLDGSFSPAAGLALITVQSTSICPCP